MAKRFLVDHCVSETGTHTLVLIGSEHSAGVQVFQSGKADIPKAKAAIKAALEAEGYKLGEWTEGNSADIRQVQRTIQATADKWRDPKAKRLVKKPRK